MKSLITVLAVAFLFALCLLNTSSAQAGFGFEDPQLCVNGKLLMIVPGSPASVYVSVPPDAVVDYSANHCGGKNNFSIPAANVSRNGTSQMTVTVATMSNTEIVFSYDGTTVTRSNSSGIVAAKFKLP